MVSLKLELVCFAFFLVLLVGCSPSGVSAQTLNQDFSLDLEIYPENAIVKGEEFSMDVILTNLGNYKLTDNDLEQATLKIKGLSARHLGSSSTSPTFVWNLSQFADELEPGDVIEDTILEDEYTGTIPSSGERKLEITLEYPYSKRITGTYCLSGEEDGVCQAGQINYQDNQASSIGTNIKTHTTSKETIFTITISNKGNGEVMRNNINANLDFGIPFTSSGSQRENTVSCTGINDNKIKLSSQTKEKTIICRLRPEQDQSYQKESKLSLN